LVKVRIFAYVVSKFWIARANGILGQTKHPDLTKDTSYYSEQCYQSSSVHCCRYHRSSHAATHSSFNARRCRRRRRRRRRRPMIINGIVVSLIGAPSRRRRRRMIRPSTLYYRE
jgi:hypothetical protein